MSLEASFTNTTLPTVPTISPGLLESVAILLQNRHRPADGKESDSLQELEAALALLVQRQGFTSPHPPRSALQGSPRPRGRHSLPPKLLPWWHPNQIPETPLLAEMEHRLFFELLADDQTSPLFNPALYS